MQALPIVERELRVAARQARTGWRRVLTTATALVVFGFVFMAMGSWRGSAFVGREVFQAFGFLGMIYALLAGPMATADCLSRERREGTLGLLFLTDLRPYDIVLGKMAAASLSFVLDFAAALPVVALPILMGGVSLSQLALVALALVNIMFLSLAIGTCASAVSRSARSSLAITVGILLFLSLGLEFLGDGILGIASWSPTGQWFYLLCPAYPIEACLTGTYAAHRRAYWSSTAATHALAWLCLWLAAWRTAHSWRDLPAAAWVLRWRERFQQWSRGTAQYRLRWRAAMLNQNPVAWLEGRERLQEKTLWGILALSAVIGSIFHIVAPNEWPDEEWTILWPMFAHYLLCLWIAIQVPRRLADDKESGALELLLCTPIGPRDIVQGCMRILWRRFGRALVALLALDLLLLYLCVSQSNRWTTFLDSQMQVLYLGGLVAFPFQGYSIARIGLYQALVDKNSLRATFTVVWKAGLLPWLVWFILMMGCEIGRNYLRPVVRLNDTFIFAAWGVMQMAVCGVFLLHANRRLRRHFRALAVQAAPQPWWKRWLPAPLAACSQALRARPAAQPDAQEHL